MSPRQNLILLTLVQEYIKTAKAISSGSLVKKYKLGISSATARNELAELESQGYIFQPHTSAGRIPTEKAYQYYVDEKLLKEKIIGPNLKDLSQIFGNNEEDLKKVARAIADFSNNAVFWAFHKNNLYYTGISNLFTQPEFQQGEVIIDVSLIIDQMEDIIADIFDQVKNGISIEIGNKNPFGSFLSVVFLKYVSQGQMGIVGILGPLRMDYQKNLSLVHFLKEKLNN